MFYKRAIITIDVSIEDTFKYLSQKYDSTLYKEAAKMSLGYVPEIETQKCEENKSLEFSCKSRDPITKLKIGGWRWGYELSTTTEGKTKVEIWYSYSLFLALMGGGTIGHQAANEICETASALEALSRGRS